MYAIRSYYEVFDFLRDLAARARPVAVRELTELQAFAREHYEVTSLEAWDVPYYSEKLREHRYQFSQEDLRPYFPVDQVIAGMFEVVERLYGLRINQRNGVDAWHDDVRFYEIRDASDDLRGCFYLDLYARAHKRGGARNNFV